MGLRAGATSIRSRCSATSVNLSAMIVALSHLIYVPAIPLVKDELGVSAASVASTIAAFTVSQSVAQVLVGPMADRSNGTRLLRMGLTLFLVSNVAIVVFPTMAGLMAGRIATGFGAGMVAGAGYALVAQSASVGKGRERALAMYQGITAVGAVAGPSSGSAIVAMTGRWESVFVVLIVASAVALATSFLLPPPSVRFHAPAPAEMWRAARNGGVLVMAMVSGVVGVAIMTMHSSLAFIFRDGDLSSQWMNSVGFAMIPCGVFSGSFLVRSLLQRHEARALLGMSLTALALSVAAFGVLQAWVGASLLLFPVLLVTGVGLGAGMALSIGVATSLAASTPGTVSAVVVVARNLGTTVAPFIVGIAYDIGRLWVAYVVAVLAIVIVHLAMVWWGRRSRDVSFQAVDVGV